MDSVKFKEPSFIAASMACLLSVLSLILHPASPPQPDSRASELRQLKAEVGNLHSLVSRIGDEMKPMLTVASAEERAKLEQKDEFDDALSKADENLKREKFAQAHEYLLVASRISATDSRLFNAVVGFISKAMISQDNEIVALAEDLLDRGDSLVHFQSPKNVESSREKLAEMREVFPIPPKKPEPESSSDPIRRLIELASNTKYPIVVRSKAIERAKNALDEAWIDSSPKESGDDLTPDKIEELRKKAEDAEKSCFEEMFKSHQVGSTKWVEATDQLINDYKNASQKPSAFLGEIEKHILRGIDLVQEVIPYAKLGVKGAQELSSKIEQRVGTLQRWKIWLYNQEALSKIRDANTKNMAVETGLLSMAKIDESLLAPYITERYAEVWKKLFDSLDENKKVEMTKKRVLKTIP